MSKDQPRPRQSKRPLTKPKKVSKRRLDMSPARAEGYAAYQEGRTEYDCPYPINSSERGEWRDGYDKAKREEERAQEKYR